MIKWQEESSRTHNRKFTGWPIDTEEAYEDTNAKEDTRVTETTDGEGLGRAECEFLSFGLLSVRWSPS